MKSYCVVQKRSLQDLVNEVEKMLNDGWLLAGGVTFGSVIDKSLENELIYFYMQALAKTSLIK